MAGVDRLSRLPDDLLRHILYFAPAKEAATTSALGRRWRSLWPSSGAVNLDSRSYEYDDDDDLDRYYKRYVIMRDAREALAAAYGNVTKLTFRYSEGEDDDDDDDDSDYESFAFADDVQEAKHDMAQGLEALLSSPAASRLEVLRVGLFYGPDSDAPGPGMLYSFSIGSLPPARSLGLLHLSKCMDFDHDVDDPFPRLVELRLHLFIVSFSCSRASSMQRRSSPPWSSTGLRSGLGTLVGSNRWFSAAPGYEGPVRSLSLKSPRPDMTRVDLCIHVPADVPTDDETCRKFVQNFSNAEIVKVDFQLLDDQYEDY
ncbi:hypothetical protein D1007_44455 [Hordeum vulgare]|nr:hypothetical protein D1007_44455 [Hordeum vulgare]